MVQFKIAKNVKEIEQTQLTADFQKQAKCYEEYHATISQLGTRLEKALPVNKETSKQKAGEDNSLGRLSTALKEYSNVISGYPKDSEGKLHAVKENLIKMAGFFDSVCPFKQKIQKIHGFLLYPLRKFHTKTFPNYQQKWQNLETARDKMDLAKHEVKQAKTMEEIEKRAVICKDAVEQFDQQCTKVLKMLEELPKHREAHVDALTKWMIAHRDYHQKMAAYC